TNLHIGSANLQLVSLRAHEINRLYAVLSLRYRPLVGQILVSQHLHEVVETIGLDAERPVRRNGHVVLARIHGAAFFSALAKALSHAYKHVRLAPALATNVVITRVTVWFAANPFPDDPLELRDVLGRNGEMLEAGESP